MKSHPNFSCTALTYLNSWAALSPIWAALCASSWAVSLLVAQLRCSNKRGVKNSWACFGCLTINTFAWGTKEHMRKWAFCYYKLCLSSSWLWSILLHKWTGWGHHRTSRNNNFLLDWTSTEVTTPKATFITIRLFFFNPSRIFIPPTSFLNWTNASVVTSAPPHPMAAMGFGLWSDTLCNIVKMLSAKTGKKQPNLWLLEVKVVCGGGFR